MFRRYLFIGLMLVLGSALVMMVLTARKQEKRVASRPTEIVQESKLTATRAISPPDLEVADSSMKVARVSGAQAAGITAHHQVNLRSRARVAYAKFMLRIEYESAGGALIESRAHTITQDIPPGDTVLLPEIVSEDLARRPVACRISVAWADLAE